jgi:hypothetical protein
LMTGKWHVACGIRLVLRQGSNRRAVSMQHRHLQLYCLHCPHAIVTTFISLHTERLGSQEVEVQASDKNWSCNACSDSVLPICCR